MSLTALMMRQVNFKQSWGLAGEAAYNSFVINDLG